MTESIQQPDKQPDSLILDEQNPWPALGAFTEEAEKFFNGRSSESNELSTLVLHSQLTVFFGRSGLGKTSLLKAGLFPRLRTKHILPVYVDLDFSSNALPFMEQLKQRFIEEVHKHDVTAPDFQAEETLWEYLHREELELWSSDNWLVTPLFVFDQFEKIFTLGNENVDAVNAFVTELADLVENRIPQKVHERLESATGEESIDLESHRAKFIFSFREDFLPAFEQWRESMPSLMQNRFRLMPMTEKQAYEAVYETGKKIVTSDVARAIVYFVARAKLKEPDTASPAVDLEPAQANATIEPALLSVLCSGLNKRRLGRNSIKMDMLQSGAESIIEEFYLDAVNGLSDGVLEYLENALITESGHRKPCALEDAQLKGGLDQSALTQLIDNRILRMETRSKTRWLELTHDLLTTIVREHRDQRRKIAEKMANEIRLKQLRRKNLRYLIGFALATLFALFSYGYDWYLYMKNTDWVWETERKTALKFDHVSNYLLWNRGKDKYLERLKEQLEDHQDDLPPGYGVNRSGWESIVLLPPEEEWPLSLHYSSIRYQDDPNFEYLFSKFWRDYAIFFVKEWGIPVPLQLKLIPEGNYPNSLLILRGDSIEPLKLDVPNAESHAFLSQSGISRPGERFLMKFKDEWTPITELDIGGPWWIVPRWSLPVWKASGITALDGSGLPALLLARELQKHPDRLLTQDAVELLLSKVAQTHPLTVAEARAVRGERLTSDFQEYVRGNNALLGLPVLLDMLADYPEGSSEDIALKVKDNTVYPEAAMHDHFTGPHKTSVQRKGDLEIHKAYKEAAVWLPSVEPEIRVYVGEDLEKQWFRGSALVPELSERLDKIRDDVFRQFGFELPGIRFRRALQSKIELGPDAFSVEVLNQDEKLDDARPVKVGNGEALDLLAQQLHLRAETYRIFYLDPDRVDAILKGMQDDVHTWLSGRYSLTDIKLLMRGIINPSSEEIDERSVAHADQSSIPANFTVPPENTIRHTPWLLASLVFWSKVDTTNSLQNMVANLRATQKAMFTKEPSAGSNTPVDNLIADGINALGSGDISAAETAFSRAVKLDRNAATSSFLSRYAMTLQPKQKKTLLKLCEDVGTARLNRSQRLDLEDLLAQKDLEQSISSQDARRLRLCLLKAYPKTYHTERIALQEQIIKRDNDPAQWPEQEAYWFGREIFEGFDPLTDNKSDAQVAFDYMTSGLFRLPVKDRYYKYKPILDHCEAPGPKKWCWDLMPTFNQAGLDIYTALNIAWALENRETEASVELAMVFIDKGVEKINKSTLKDEERERLLDWIQLARARAYGALIRLGQTEKIQITNDLLQSLLNSKDEVIRENAYFFLTLLRLKQGQLDEARELNHKALNKWPDENAFYANQLIISLTAGDTKQVVQIAAKARAKLLDESGNVRITEQNQDFAFDAALGMLMSESGPWELASREFLDTQHQYVPYIAMLLYAKMSGTQRSEAKEVIDRFWSKAEPNTWDIRLQEGDITAWREMLIGYYAGEGKGAVLREQIFGDLEDEARFSRSKLHNLPTHRIGLLSEAYFYDAMLAMAKEDHESVVRSLNKVIETDQRHYFEYAMAKYMLLHRYNISSK